ncbi:DUF1642 domain-containing protein [Streptococcus gordonii]|uniref:DUF1642 domain-containing protein n=1 Tax=Streptococcus gordonii TaxID=1302 RepID=UPI002284F5D2|nr:DUF1642 domain-containing protein [Streptococcus gordonii]MCY7168808.1 DUF1642 domain-containing protein [Streptococcus gordonii]
MNKKELIKKYEDACFAVIPVDEVLEDLRQLDEPQKVTIPQFVANWIEEGKKTCRDVGDLFEFDFDSEDVERWFLDYKPFDLIARAWLDGYEVEKEKRYLVKVKNVLTRQSALNRNKKSGRFIFSNPEENSLYDTKFTREELEDAGFGWVFSCEGIEIEEVEE